MSLNVSVSEKDGKCSPSQDVPSHGKKREITNTKILCCIFSIGAYIADVALDIYVAFRLYKSGNDTYFGLTVLFIVLPAVIMSLVSFRWYVLDNSIDDLKVPTAHWIIRIIFLILLMAPALRNAEALYYAWKGRKTVSTVDKENYGQRMISTTSRSSCLRIIEAFLECAPQLILQIYIIAQVFCDGSNNISTTEIVQLISIFTSLISMTNVVVSYLRNLREYLADKNELVCSISIFPFLWRFFDIAARVVTLGLFASVFLPYLFLLCSIHMWAMLLWIRFMNTDFCSHKIVEFMYNLVISFVYIFCFINLTSGNTRKCYVMYYFINFVENTTLISIWYHHCLFEYRLLVLIMVFACSALSIAIMVFYYVLLHPTRGTLFRESCSEERNVISQSKNIVDQLTSSRELIDRTEIETDTSEKMQTAVVQNERPTEVDSRKEETMLELSEGAVPLLEERTLPLNFRVYENGNTVKEMSEKNEIYSPEN